MSTYDECKFVFVGCSFASTTKKWPVHLTGESLIKHIEHSESSCSHNNNPWNEFLETFPPSLSAAINLYRQLETTGSILANSMADTKEGKLCLLQASTSHKQKARYILGRAEKLALQLGCPTEDAAKIFDHVCRLQWCDTLKTPTPQSQKGLLNRVARRILQLDY
jgi:hypothetical protein